VEAQAKTATRKRRRRVAPREEPEREEVKENPKKGWSGFPSHLRSAQLAAGLKSGQFLVGRLRCPKTIYLGLVFVPDHGDFVVKGSQAINRAVDGDLVVIERLTALQEKQYDKSAANLRHGKVSEAEEVAKVLRDSNQAEPAEEKPSARVVAIRQRSQREIGGSIYELSEMPDAEEVLQYKEVEEDDVVLVSSNRRFPRLLLKRSEVLRLSGQKTLPKDKRFAAVLTNWSQDCQLPRGRFSRLLGNAGQLETETELILMEYDVNDQPFSEEVMKCLPPSDFKVTKKLMEQQKRTDFRDLCVFSIDPPGCEDVDDALSCEKLENGNFRVGVHIADVTNFVKAGTPLDREGAERATSVYLVNRRVDMLPRLLTTDICSLRCDGKDRLCFSAVFEMNPEAKVLSSYFAKGVIRSRAALSYKEAQERLDTQSDDEIGQALQHLAALARKLRAKRFEDGAIELEGGELKFELDTNTQLPQNVFKYETQFTNNLIEEFMLLANRQVAQEISATWPEISLLRRHPPPKESRIKTLVELLEASGIEDFRYKSNKALQKSLDSVEKADDPFFNRLVRLMTTRCMEEALYFATGCEEEKDWKHFGLAMDQYTHFTSPIRRYADCVVHRLLSASQGFEELPEILRDKEEIADCCTHLNFKNKNAREADRASVEFYLYQFFQQRGPTVAEGVVMRVVKEGISVAVEEYGAEGIAELEQKSWGVLAEQQLLYGRPNTKFDGFQIKVFDRVVVSIQADEDDLTKRTLKFTFLGMPSRLPDGSQAPMPEVADKEVQAPADAEAGSEG